MDLRKLYSLFFMLLLPMLMFSQSAKISGYVYVNSEILSWVNVLLVDSLSKNVIAGKMTNEEGYFEFDDLQPSTYILEVSFIGLEKKIIPVKISSSDDDVKLDNIRLKYSSTTLDDVVLVAERPTLTREGGKTVLNVSQALGESPTMADLMENIPSVQISEDDGVSIRGEKPVFLIDGIKASAEEFNSLSPDLISAVEVHTNASAKYSGSKVINVVLRSQSYEKKMVKAAAFYGTDNFLKGQLNAMLRKNKWNFSGGAYFQNRNSYREQLLVRNFDTKEQILFQEKKDSINNQKTRLYSNISYSINNRNRVGIKASYIVNNDSPKNYLDNRYELSNSRDNERMNVNDNKREVYNFLTLWQHKFKDDSNLEISMKLQTQPSLRVNNASTEYPGSSRVPKLDRFIFDESKKFMLAKADYDKSLSSNFRIETGGELKWTSNRMISEVSRFSYLENDWEINKNKSYVYDYYEEMASYYLSGLYTLNKWDFNVGVRIEYIHWDSEVKDSVVSKYVFVPSPVLSVVYNLDKRNSFNIGASRRIVVPGYMNLNPHIDESNPDVLRSGNPDLNPPVIWNFELGHSYNIGKFSNNVTMFYRSEEDKIARVFTQTQNDNVFLSRPDNISNAVSVGMDLSQKIKILKNWTISTYFMVYHYRLSGGNLDDRADEDGIMGSVKINSMLKLPYNFRFGCNYNYNGQRIIPNGTISPESYFNIKFFKSLLDKKLQLTFKIDDIFKTRKTHHEVYANGSYSESDRSFNSRLILLSASYKID